ncbi:MAG TPA: hypothetical protein VFT15_04000 [Chitinophagaceae bacterium]|nr:hypothetical protein [Chitinophagaceae bacterium]
MKAKSSLTFLVSLVTIALVFTQCQKGDTGPAGPAGPAGAAGPTGAPGPKGDTGTANVIYSPWLDVEYEADTLHNGALIDTVGYYATITAAKLTNAILNSGEIKVYVNFGTAATPVITALPYFDIYSLLSIEAYFRLQEIFLYSDADVSTETVSGQKYLQYRYILIPGSVPSGRRKYVDWNNYNEVKAFLGLTD